MATDHYTNLIEQLKSIPRGNSEGANERGKNQAIQYVTNSDLSDNEKQSIIQAIVKSANPSGWYTVNNGVNAAIETLNTLRANITASEQRSSETNGKPLIRKRNDNNALTHHQSISTTFNRRNLKNLVSDGKIFSVEFVKRSTGELRTMTARLGVRKHLQGSKKAFNPAQHNLLTVFDMDAKGYRSIPVEAIQGLTVGGQTFDFARV